jgi:hypothetical protein
MKPSFASLRKGYPTEDRAALFRALGGQWPDLIPNTANYGNTCALRLSMALKRAGIAIPPAFKEGLAGDGSPLVIKVATMGKLVTSLFGQPWGMSKPPGAPLEASDLPTFSGIVAYHVQWRDATGHVDLWTGRGFVGSGNLADVRQGFEIAIWRID